MRRRSFLNSVLGIASSPLLLPGDFFLKTDDDEPQRVILPYQTFVHDTYFNKWIQAPAPAHQFQYFDGFSIVSEELKLFQPVNFDKVVVIIGNKSIDIKPYGKVHWPNGGVITVIHNFPRQYNDLFDLKYNLKG